MNATPQRWFVGFLLLTIAAASASAAPPLEVRIKYGDDPQWAARDFDDRGWKRITSAEIPAHAGPFWLRIRIARGIAESITQDPLWQKCLNWPEDQAVDSICLAAVFSFDFYWDGQRLERSGTVGTSRATEVPGEVDHVIRIPDALWSSGEHVIALRMSSYHYNFPGRPQFTLALFPRELKSFLQRYHRSAIIPLMLSTGALIIAAISLVMFLFTERRRSLLLAHILSVLLAVFYALIGSVFLVNVTYEWFAPRYMATAGVAAALSFLLPWLLAEQFAVLRRGQWLVLLVPLLIAAWFSSFQYELKALWVCRAMLLVSAMIVAFAAWRRRPGAIWLIPVPLIGIPLVQANSRLFLNPSFFIFLEALVFYVFAALGWQVRAERQRARELMLTTARLETELLKRNIQPHFLLNTLATIIEMIEQTPKNAVAIIEALASEFRILARMSGEKLVPITQEVELCRSHLQIMSLRKGACCTLATEGIDPTALVPPALFHTLVENGLTHLMPRDGKQAFVLQATPMASGVRYSMTVAGAAHERPGAARGGTGTRYIQARLEESFPGRWSLSSEAIGDGWRTVIEIQTESATVEQSTPVRKLATWAKTPA